MSYFTRVKFPISVRKYIATNLISRDLCSKTPNSRPTSKKLTPEIIAKREKYLAFEANFETQADYTQLSSREKVIHELHKEAVEQFKWTYIDPDTGFKVNTRFRKYLLEKCCGSGCRHCIYGHEAVPIDQKDLKRFNTAFWTPVESA